MHELAELGCIFCEGGQSAPPNLSKALLDLGDALADAYALGLHELLVDPGAKVHDGDGGEAGLVAAEL